MKIWTYGCSFTSGYEHLLFSDKLWPYHLDIGRKYEVVNRGHGGGGFYDVRRYLLTDIGTISSEDLVIVQLPTSNRVCIPYFETEWDSFMRIRHEHPDSTVGWLKYMKDREGLIETLKDEVEIVFDLMLRLQMKWMWWSAEKASKSLYGKYPYSNLKLDGIDNYEEWIFSNSEYWYNDNDWHQNELGHKKMGELFSNHVKTYLSWWDN